MGHSIVIECLETTHRTYGPPYRVSRYHTGDLWATIKTTRHNISLATSENHGVTYFELFRRMIKLFYNKTI